MYKHIHTLTHKIKNFPQFSSMEACLSVVSRACEAAVCACLAMDLKNFLQGVVSFFLKDLFYLFVYTRTYI